MTDFTPGPWEVIGGPVSGTWHVAAAYDDGGEIAALESREDEQANARLMAAAPDLLDALRGFTEWVEVLDPMSPGTSRLYLAARTAIAKAEGRKP